MKLTEEQRELAAEWVPMALKLSNRFASIRPACRDDIESAAMFGLVKAASTFRHIPGGATFSTIAWRKVRWEIVDALRTDSGGLAGMKTKAARRNPVRCTPSSSPGLIRRSVPIATGIVPAPDEVVDERDAAEAILARLPAAFATAVRLTVIEGMSHRHAAERMGLDQTTVSRLVKRSRQLLRGPPCSC